MAVRPRNRDPGLPPARAETVRARILESAAAVFLEQGFAGTKLTEIAAKSGLQAGSLYYHFENRARLVDEIIAKGVLDNFAASERAANQTSSTSAGVRLEAAIDAHLRAILEPGSFAPAAIALLAQVPPEVRLRLEIKTAPFLQFWEKLILDAQEEGYFPVGLSIDALRALIIFSMNAIVNWPPEARRDPDHVVETFHAFLPVSSRPPPDGRKSAHIQV